MLLGLMAIAAAVGLLDDMSIVFVHFFAVKASMCIARLALRLPSNRGCLDIISLRNLFRPLLSERMFLRGRTNAVHGLLPSLLNTEGPYSSGLNYSDPHIDGLHA